MVASALLESGLAILDRWLENFERRCAVHEPGQPGDAGSKERSAYGARKDCVGV